MKKLPEENTWKNKSHVDRVYENRLSDPFSKQQYPIGRIKAFRGKDYIFYDTFYTSYVKAVTNAMHRHGYNVRTIIYKGSPWTVGVFIRKKNEKRGKFK